MMKSNFIASSLIVLWLSNFAQIGAQDDLARILGRCQKSLPGFDECMKTVMNDLRVFYPTGIPQFNIKPFDPHHAEYIEQRRGNRNFFGGFQLILRNVSEYGWTQSDVTKFKTDFASNRIVYSQYFPEKSLEGYYEFSGTIFGQPRKQHGIWNLTLSDYSQTTSVRRLGGPGAMLKVHVEVDRIGGMDLHISDVLGSGRSTLNTIADTVINSMWKIGLPFIKPLIDELVSTAFTDIFNESFRYFPIDSFIT